MDNGQSVFFSLASPALRIRACEAHALALTLLLPYSKPIFGKKNPTVLQSRVPLEFYTLSLASYLQTLYFLKKSAERARYNK